MLAILGDSFKFTLLAVSTDVKSQQTDIQGIPVPPTVAGLSAAISTCFVGVECIIEIAADGGERGPDVPRLIFVFFGLHFLNPNYPLDLLRKNTYY